MALPPYEGGLRTPLDAPWADGSAMGSSQAFRQREVRFAAPEAPKAKPKKGGILGSILGIAGTIVGSVYGGPPGGAAGGAVGTELGSAIEGRRSSPSTLASGIAGKAGASMASSGGPGSVTGAAYANL